MTRDGLRALKMASLWCAVFWAALVVVILAVRA